MPVGKMAYLTRGPFPVSFESQSLHLSVYSKFRRFFFRTECIVGVQQWERKLDSLFFPAIATKSFITFKSLSPMQMR